MNDDIAQLVREERLLEAAALAEAGGDLVVASSLYERACAWDRAARVALAAGQAARALELAVEAGDEALAHRAIERVRSESPPLEALAARLESRGRDSWAARVLEASGRAREAAQAWERCGDVARAAELWESAGEPVNAAKALEAGLRRNPQDGSVSVALGALLLRYGRSEAAVRVLQRVPGAAPERSRAVMLLLPALEKLGLRAALDEVNAEAESHGWRPGRQVPEPARTRGTRLFGRYDVVNELSSSATARVLECFDVVRGERVALKVFAGWSVRGGGRDALARFDREARATRLLDHPHVVPMLDFVDMGPAIVLRWMGGGTLEKLLASGPPMAPARAAEIARAVLSALGEAHRIGILHRDVKPSNVLFDEGGGPRLSDFGVAHLADASTTATAGAFGTLAYMSPEQREGRPATVQSDLFSVGIVLREMLTGERGGAGEAPLPSAHHRGLDERHDRLVASWTSAHPAERPADAFAARDALASLPWPANAESSRPMREEPPRSAQPEGRVHPQPDGRLFDRWTDRPVEMVVLRETTLSRARAFALADHPALQAVLRVDREGGALWLEPCDGPGDRRITADERAELSSALSALHAVGQVHGLVDRAHVGVAEGRGGRLVLRFGGDPPPGATAEGDRAALLALG